MRNDRPPGASIPNTTPASADIHFLRSSCLCIMEQHSITSRAWGSANITTRHSKIDKQSNLKNPILGQPCSVQYLHCSMPPQPSSPSSLFFLAHRIKQHIHLVCPGLSRYNKPVHRVTTIVVPHIIASPTKLLGEDNPFLFHRNLVHYNKFTICRDNPLSRTNCTLLRPVLYTKSSSIGLIVA